MAPRRVPPCFTASVAVKYLHKGYRSTCYTTCGKDLIVLGPKAAKGKACTSAALMYKSGIFHRVKDALHAVFHRQHKTNRQLLQLPSCVRGVGELGKNSNRSMI